MKRDEKGSASVWMAMLVVVMVLAIGIAVDLSGLVGAKQRAFDVAQQAGRAASNQVQVGQVMMGQTPTIDIGAARAAAASYLSASGVSGTVTITGPQSLHVHVTGTYSPKFLSAVGSRPISADADITLSRTVNGAQR